MLFRAFRINGEFVDVVDTTEGSEFTGSEEQRVQVLADALEVIPGTIEVVISDHDPRAGTLIPQPVGDSEPSFHRLTATQDEFNAEVALRVGIQD